MSTLNKTSFASTLPLLLNIVQQFLLLPIWLLLAVLVWLEVLALTIFFYLKNSFGPRPGEALCFASSLGWNRRSGAISKVMLGVFSGCSQLCASFEKLGWKTVSFDNDLNKADDSLSDDCFFDLLRGIYELRLGAVHLRIPCRTWSIATNPLFRNHKHIVDGSPDLSRSECSLVSEGNELLRRSLFIIRLAAWSGIMVSLENPNGSLLWAHPEVLCCLQDYNFAKAYVEYCMYGRPYKKPTAIAATFPQIKHVECLCSGDHLHVTLKGKSALGDWLTAGSASYTMEICDIWSSCVVRGFSCHTDVAATLPLFLTMIPV